MSRHHDYTLTAGDLSANYTSEPIDLGQLSAVAIHAIVSGTPNGSIKIQASIQGVEWDDATTGKLVAGAGNFLWTFSQFGFRYLRVMYLASSGTGSIQTHVGARGDL